MIIFIERPIKYYIQRLLLDETEQLIEKAKNRFIELYPTATPAKIEHVEALLRREAKRVYHIVKSGVLSANIIRARYIFWGLIVLGIPILMSLNIVFPVNPIPQIITAFLSWMMNCITIPTLCRKRIVGGLKSVVQSQVEELTEKDRVSGSSSLSALSKLGGTKNPKEEPDCQPEKNKEELRHIVIDIEDREKNISTKIQNSLF